MNYHTTPIWCIKFSPTGHYFASGSSDGAVCLWSIEYNTPLKILAGHLFDVFIVQFHPRATFLATGGGDKTIRLWECSTGDCVRVFCGHQAPVSYILFSKNGKNLYSADEEGKVQFWDINEKEVLWKIYCGGAVSCIAVSQENTILACTLNNNSLVLVAADGKIIKKCKAKDLRLYTCLFTLRNMLTVAGSFN